MNSSAKLQKVETDVPIQGTVTGITRKFIGDCELRELLPPILETQLDNLVNKYYHANRAETVASQITQAEGVELL